MLGRHRSREPVHRDAADGKFGDQWRDQPMPYIRTTTPANTINDLTTASSVILVELGAPFPISGVWTKIVIPARGPGRKNQF